MAINDAYKVLVAQSLLGQNILNIGYWVQSFETGTGITVLERNNGFFAWFQAAYTTGAVDQYTFRAVGTQHAFPLPLEDMTFSTTTPVNGDQEDEPLPIQTCGLIKLGTGFAGRGFRGRKYIGGFGETNNTNAAKPAAPALTRLVAIGVTWSTVLTIVGAGGTATYLPYITNRDFSRKNRIFTATVRPNWATQRRRSLIAGVEALIPVVV